MLLGENNRRAIGQQGSPSQCTACVGQHWNPRIDRLCNLPRKPNIKDDTLRVGSVQFIHTETGRIEFGSRALLRVPGAIMADQRIRFGILGCAKIARKLLRAIELAPNAVCYAIGSRSLEKAKAFASANSVSSEVKLYGSYEMVLDDPFVDAVYVPLPTSLHLEWAVKSAHKKKHILLEKPVAPCVDDLDKIIDACETNGVQLMDGTMWMHHPRTAKMEELVGSLELFGDLKKVSSTFTYSIDSLQNNIRVKADLDALGALGDAGWYCIRAILWANNYEMPQSVTALPGPIFNEAGVILDCGSSFFWKDGRVGTFYCSFLSDLSMDLSIYGPRGTLHLHDFVIPYEKDSAKFTFSSDAKLPELGSGWDRRPVEHLVHPELPQEVLMVQEFARLVKTIRDCEGKPDPWWPSIARKTQILVNAVERSIKQGFVTVTL